VIEVVVREGPCDSCGGSGLLGFAVCEECEGIGEKLSTKVVSDPCASDHLDRPARRGPGVVCLRCGRLDEVWLRVPFSELPW